MSHNDYFFDEELDHYHDGFTHYADQVARKEIKLSDVPRQYRMNGMFYDEVFFLVTGILGGIELHQKSAIVQGLLDGSKGDLNTCHCHDTVSASNVDSVR